MLQKLCSTSFLQFSGLNNLAESCACAYAERGLQPATPREPNAGCDEAHILDIYLRVYQERL